MLRRRHNWLLVALLVGACSQEQDAAQLNAHVTNDQFKTAQEIIDGIDYLPFGYVADGCFARSYYMSMELAIAGIPSSAQAVTVCQPDTMPSEDVPREELLCLADGTCWTWHVAPLVVVGGDEYVIDPVMSPSPMRRHEWMSYMSHQQPVNFFLSAAAYPTSGRQVSGLCNQDVGYEAMPSSFEAMLPFDASWIAEDCGFMHSYIAKLADVSESDKALKQARLIERTKYLVGRLRELGKLNESFAIDLDAACRVVYQ